jgi:hypothetical protein
MSAARPLVDRFGPWAVVTGASDGIGRAFAAELAAGGLHLVLAARRAPPLEALAAELRARHGVEVDVVAVDLSAPGGVDHLVRATADREVGLLVAAAGFGSAGPFLAAPLDEALNMVELNCGAALALCHRYGGALARRGRGGLVLLSSIVAFQGVPLSATYAATKAFVQSLAEGLAGELGPAGVSVLAVAPGPVRSGFAARAGMVMGATVSPEDVARGGVAALARGGTTRPGALSALLGWSLALLPRALRVRVMAKIMAGMAQRPG